MQLIIILNYLTCIIFFKSLLLDIIGVIIMIDKEVIMLILMPIIIFGIVKPYLDKRREKKDREQLNKRLWKGY